MLVIPEKDIVARNLQEQVAENTDDIAGLKDDYEELKEQIDTQVIPMIPDSYLKYASPNYSNGLLLGGIGDQDQTFKYFYVPVASASTTGVINTSAQSFGGVKTFNAGIKAYEISSLYGSEKIQPDKIMHWFQWLPGTAAVNSIYSGNPYTISNATIFNSITACDRLEIGTSVPAGAIPGWDNGQILWTKIRGRGSLNTTMFSATINGSQYQFWLDRPNSTITFKKPGTYANYAVYTNDIAAATTSLMSIRSAASIEVSAGADVDILSDGGTINVESHGGDIALKSNGIDLNAGQGEINLYGQVFVNEALLRPSWEVVGMYDSAQTSSGHLYLPSTYQDAMVICAYKFDSNSPIQGVTLPLFNNVDMLLADNGADSLLIRAVTQDQTDINITNNNMSYFRIIVVKTHLF